MVDHIHTANYGRGRRDVFVNGNRIEFVVWADERAGIVWFCPQPLRLSRRGEVYSRCLRGRVQVVSHG